MMKNKLEGIGWFTYEILSRLVKNHPELKFYFLFDRKFDDSFAFSNNVTLIKINPPARHPFLWYVWFEHSIPSVLKKVNADVFISTDGYLSLKTKVKSLLFWHDLSYLHFPDHVPFLTRKYYEIFVPLFLKKADKIITFSTHSKNEIVEQMSVPPSKVAVSYGASRETFVPLSDSAKAHTRAKISNGCPYFLYVGALQPRKNVDSIIKAFDIFRQRTGSNYKLLIAGRFAWQYDAILEAFNGADFKEDINFIGHVETEIGRIVGSAYALIYPSFYEGFGLPIIESISCHVPVITSNISSMPEVCGDAGLLVNPNSVEAIANAMQQLFYDRDLYQTLQTNCIRQSQKFNWDKTAEALYEVLMSMM